VISHDQDRVTLALTTAETRNPFNGNPLEAVAAMPSSSVAPVSGDPMMVFPVRIERALDVAVQCPHDADAREPDQQHRSG